MIFNKRTFFLLSEIVTLLLAATLLTLYFDEQEQAQLSASQGEPQVTRLTSSSKRLELRIFNADKAYPGFTLLPVSGTAEVLLLNMQGNVVHKWDVDADRARLLPNGDLLVVHGSKWGLDREPWEALRPVVRQYSWNGEIRWEFTAPDIAHHDVQRLPNGNTLVLYRSIIPVPAQYLNSHGTEDVPPIRSDSIMEVSPAGNVVWNWHAHEHLPLDSCGRRKCRSELGAVESSGKFRDWTHMNTISPIPDNRWFQEGDARFRPGNLLVIPRNFWQVMIVDRNNGEIVWKYGGSYKGGIIRGHEAHMIPLGLPGAGNILIFDNGVEGKRQASIALEINPVTKKPVWTYEAGKDFFSRAAGSLHRLPNGNTFISEDVPGRVFEVSQEGEIVWELKSPYRLSRAKRYPRDHSPQLAKLILEEYQG